MHKRKSFLWIGFLGAILSIAGFFLPGLTPVKDPGYPLTAFLSSLSAAPSWRICLCLTLGGIGMLLQYFGYLGIYKGFDDRENRRGRFYCGATWCFTVIGALLHVVFCGFLLFYPSLMGSAAGEKLLMDYLLICGAPMLLITSVGFLLVCLILFIQLGGGHSCFPRWVVILNPIVVPVIIVAVSFFLPASWILNGISFAGMHIASFLLFTGLLLADRQR